MAKKWYVIQTYSGYENKVKEALLQRIKEHGKEALFGEVLIPTETVQETRGNGKQKSPFYSVEMISLTGGLVASKSGVSIQTRPLSRVTPTKDNLELRVYAVGISLDGSHIAGDFDRAERCLLLMHSIADEEADTQKAAPLRERILTWEIELARARNDEARITAKLDEALGATRPARKGRILTEGSERVPTQSGASPEPERPL